MIGDFRYEIYQTVGSYIETNCSPFQHGDIVDAILDMPEMEAIRQFILDTAIDNGITMNDKDHPFWRLSDGSRMPQSVIDWVLGGPS